MQQAHSTAPDREKHQQYRDINIEKIKMVSNRILCRQLTHNIDSPIKGIYYPPSRNQNSDMEVNADRIYEVASIPERLVINKHSMWETEIEVEVGDVVWTTLIAALNAPEIKVGDETYRMILYQDLIVAKRNEKVIPLNGNVIMENIVTREVSGFNPMTQELTYAPVINYSIAKVKHKGKMLKGYTRIDRDDKGANVKNGDIVVLNLPNKNNASAGRKYIEHDMRSMFSEHRYFYEKRKDFMGVLKMVEDED